MSDIIYKKKEMMKKLAQVSNDVQNMSNMKLIEHLQAELHAVDKTEVDLEAFELEQDIDKLNISVLTEQIQKTASEL